MADARAAIAFDHVVKVYPNGEHAVNDVSLEIPPGTFAVFVGPSGSGKTTLLKTINRLYDVTSGRVLVDGVDVATTDPVALRRGIGYVIQQVGLFPHMTIAENIAVVPSLLGWDRARIDARVDELLALVHLEPERYRQRYPSQLSGGQQQRIGLARALAADPQILLMDEPFGALDAIERERLQHELAELHARLAQDDRIRDPRRRRGAASRRPFGRHEARAAWSKRARRSISSPVRQTSSSPPCSMRTM